MPWVSLQDNSVRFYHGTLVIFSHSKPAFCAIVLGNWVFIYSVCITGILTFLCVTDVIVILKTDAISEYGFMTIPPIVDPFGCVQSFVNTQLAAKEKNVTFNGLLLVEISSTEILRVE